MKKFFVFTGVASAALMLFGCALVAGGHWSNPESFKGKTGVIGVFRQPAFYCGENIPHYMTLGGTSVVVKPGFSHEQDNLFVGEIKPGPATLTSYQYTCGGRDNNLTLDTTGSANERFPVSLVVPEKGFCKVVVSFLEGDKLFSHDGSLLKDVFDKEKVALNYDSIPFCEVLDNKGGKVSMLNRDSALDARFAAALEDVANVEDEERFTLFPVDQSTDKVMWDAFKTKMLMAVLTSESELFKDETTVKTEKEMIAVSEREFFLWFRDNKNGVRDWSLRLKQLFGYSRNVDFTHVSLIWVSPKDLMRTAYVPSITESIMRTSFDGEMSSDSIDAAKMIWFRNWFEAEKAKSYNPNGRAWTRLGYTYDWGGNGNEYGLSEFLILPGAEVEVKLTKSIKIFANWMSGRQ